MSLIAAIFRYETQELNFRCQLPIIN
uniref:Uncharacterized protein n=1 Tax=Rhizophora mucronata TaxID=61149 RepID=A0A2P2N1Z0_RHIMU